DDRFLIISRRCHDFSSKTFNKMMKKPIGKPMGDVIFEKRQLVAREEARAFDRRSEFCFGSRRH
ncbi:MAG TPA: hypothetical protein PKO33_07500, partial [Pyrinomonadaceae bacterium]|nr:hypothetical protein [Pyrinomonadaceae bacterium]